MIISRSIPFARFLFHTPISPISKFFKNFIARSLQWPWDGLATWKRNSRTEERPVDGLRSKFGARVNGVNIECFRQRSKILNNFTSEVMYRPWDGLATVSVRSPDSLSHEFLSFFNWTNWTNKTNGTNGTNGWKKSSSHNFAPLTPLATLGSRVAEVAQVAQKCERVLVKKES